MRDKDGHELRRELAACERGRGKRYPTELKHRVVRWAKTQVDAGERVSAIASVLGVNRESVRRWVLDTEASALVEVTIADPEAASLSISSPRGYRIDGLSVATAAALLRELG